MVRTVVKTACDFLSLRALPTIIMRNIKVRAPMMGAKVTVVMELR